MASSDSNNFSSSSPHRLPTVSASQALQNISSTPRRPIPTGLKSLDAFLQGREHEDSSQTVPPVGIPRGEVTEIYGPPGVGKTTLALRDILSVGRISEGEATSDPASVDRYLEKFHHFITPSLPHLLALLAHQSSTFPPTETNLVVVDSISTLFALAFPKTAENASSQQNPIRKSDAGQWASGRRWAVMGDLISKISRLAATKNIAILLTSQTTTRIRSETGAVLHPAISGTGWDTGISTRMVIFRDWVFQASETASSQGEYIPGVRLAGVMKAKGISYEGVGKVVMFVIEKTRLREITVDQTKIRLNGSPVLPATSLKRKRGEIANSQSGDEDPESDREFGWAADDDIRTTEALLE
ncbi:hypothetical protein HO133_009936 [Letharia lupina]|uniref:RecA family profile 1 domain-containing protein n=1 Tax=Letharia lupina TaxID=560253 RepID=A0A8H6CJU2_9LECA|nr:uncharacterized protein HO133_009936 [Letharia lupina]KAF6224742.1 hypothetical protein HO133_009936 [Letharia lupina]